MTELKSTALALMAGTKIIDVDQEDTLERRLRMAADAGSPAIAKPVLDDYLTRHLTIDPSPSSQTVDAANYLIRSLGVDGLAMVLKVIEEYSATPQREARRYSSEWAAGYQQVAGFTNPDRRSPELLPAMMTRYTTLINHAAVEAAVSPDHLQSPEDNLAQWFNIFVKLANLHNMDGIIQQAEALNAEGMDASSGVSVSKAIGFNEEAKKARAATEKLLQVIRASMLVVLDAGLKTLPAIDKVDLVKSAILSGQTAVRDSAITQIALLYVEIANLEGVPPQGKLKTLSDIYLLTHDHRNARKEFVSEQQAKSFLTALNRAIGIIAGDQSVPVTERAAPLAHAYHNFQFPEAAQEHITSKLSALYKEIGAGDQEQALRMQGDFLLGIQDSTEKGASLQVFAEELGRADPLIAAKVAWGFLVTPKSAGKKGGDILSTAFLQACDRMGLAEAIDAFGMAAMEALAHKATAEIVRVTLDTEGRMLSKRAAAIEPTIDRGLRPKQRRRGGEPRQ